MPPSPPSPPRSSASLSPQSPNTSSPARSRLHGHRRKHRAKTKPSAHQDQEHPSRRPHRFAGPASLTSASAPLRRRRHQLRREVSAATSARRPLAPAPPNASFPGISASQPSASRKPASRAKSWSWPTVRSSSGAGRHPRRLRRSLRRRRRSGRSRAGTIQATRRTRLRQLGFDASITDAAGEPYTQAGGHPYEFSTEFNFATVSCVNPEEEGSAPTSAAARSMTRRTSPPPFPPA